MAWKHVSLPQPFSEGDPVEWFKGYDICCKANGWDEDARAAKLPTLLEGEALAVWSELKENQQVNYERARWLIIEKMAPAGFVSLSNVNQRKLQPVEVLSVYLHELKRLLNQAIPNLDAATQNQLLCHQFLIGIPGKISRQLRAAGEIDNIAKVLERAKLLMTLEGEEKVAVVSPQATSLEVQELKDQMARLTEQVAALATQKDSGGPSHSRFTTPRGCQVCYFCQQPGHLKRNCPHRRPPPICMWPEGTHCQRLQAGKWKRGTQFGPWASPDVLGPFKAVDADVVIAAVRSNTAIVRGQLGSVDMDMMLDSRSSVSLVRKDILSEVSEVCAAASRELRLVTAAGEPIKVLGYVSVKVKVGQVSVEHPFVVVKSLIAGVILGIDFLRQHELVLDFAFSPIKVLCVIIRDGR